MHTIFNETEIRETHLILNGKNRSPNPYHEDHIKLTGHRCITTCVEEVDFDVEVEDRIRYWSVPEDWPDGVLPAEGEDVHIEPAWNMVYDLEEPSPVFQLVRINGNLTFAPDMDLNFRAKHIFIRAGNLNLGTPEEPLTANVNITLHGEKNAEAMVYDNAVEAGNKLIAVTGRVQAYGKPRKGKATRLTQPALRNESSFFVEPGLEYE
jgi:hypothetical protein